MTSGRDGDPATRPLPGSPGQLDALQQQLDATPVTIVRLDRDGRITHVNAAWREFASANGADEATLRGVGLRYITAPSSGDLEALLAGRIGTFSCVYTCHSPSVLRWFHLDARRDPRDGSVVLTHRDVTAEQSAEARLRLQTLVARDLAAGEDALGSCLRLARAACEEFEWDFAVTWVPGEGDRLACRALWTRPGCAVLELERATVEARLASGDDLPGTAWRTRSALWVPELATETRFPRAADAVAAGLRSGFAVPLSAAGEVYAVIECHGRIGREADTALLELLEGAGELLGARLLRGRAERLAAEVETARCRAVEESAASERRFRQILDAIQELVIVKGPGSRILWANRAFRELYGMSNEALQGMIDAPFNEPDYTQQYIRDDAHVFESGETLVIDDEPVTRWDGTVRRVRTTKSAIVDDAGNVVMLVGVCHDITERQRLEARMRLQDRMASVGTLAAGVAHEINTPVQFVGDSVVFLRDAAKELEQLQTAYRELLRRVTATAPPADVLETIASILAAEELMDLEYVNENIPLAFERCIDGLGRIRTIVRSMKEFAHPAHDVAEPFDLNRSVQNTLTVARSEYKYVAEIETEFGELPMVNGFVSDINQTLLNIIVNAAHAIGDVVKEPGQRGVIKVCTWQDGGDVVVSIADTGAGIAPDVVPHVFEQFFTTKPVGKGTGQGLALAWATVTERHGGELTFESALGKGTTFFMRLPIAGKRAAAV